MARLHEYQGKELLKSHKVLVPKGRVVSTPEEARQVAEELGGEVMVKAQAWVTGRAGMGGIRRASTPEEAEAVSREMLGLAVKGFTVEQVLVEERLDIEREFYAGVIINDRARAPVAIFSSVGGTGIEQIARDHPDKVAQLEIDIVEGLQDYQARDLVRRTGVHGKLLRDLGGMVTSLYEVARAYEARAAEINPLVVTKDGKLYAADCRITVDDYAAFRHPELGIEIAREFDRPPTALEKIAFQVEAKDYRGTFYFIQMADDFQKGDGYIGFHGAGGGGSMMSMDALLSRKYKLATYVDTSGNPPASKVYRAARIVLSMPGIDGYFASGSGVASQEQFHSARGFVKAFMEDRLSVPAVIRLGGNMEEKAIEILQRAASEIPAPLEAYGKDDTADFCAGRLDALIKEGKVKDLPPAPPRAEPKEPYTFESPTGTVTYDHAVCDTCESKVCVETCVRKILKLEDGRPVLNISMEDAKGGRCIECLACEVECHFAGAGGGHVELPIPGLEEYRQGLLTR
jgi:succinyl-CoA synthetase beta subunit